MADQQQRGPGRERLARSDAHPNAHQGAAPMEAGQARAVTERIRHSIAQVERAWTVLADLVRQAYQGQAWRALGYASWGQYAHAEFGIGRAHAYRLVDIATTAERLQGAIASLTSPTTGPTTGMSPAGGTLALLSGRALRDVRDRVDQVAAVLAGHLQQAAAAGRDLTGGDIAELVHQSVEEVRSPPPAPPPTPPTRPPSSYLRGDLVAQGRALVDQFYEAAEEVGRICLALAPAYLADDQAAVRLAPYAEEVGLALNNVLARRRYALTGDRRSLNL